MDQQEDQGQESRENVPRDEGALGNKGEKNRPSGQRDRSSGITNRGIDRERQDLADRGRPRTDSGSDSDSESER